MSVRVRFAPSPTGSLHLGNALTAIANRAFADRHGGELLLRIDDTDPTRVVAGGEAAILADLDWLGVRWDAGPLRQSGRADVYAAAIERMLASGSASEDVDGSIRVGRTTVVRPDGSATYQLASVVDDLELGITHVIRGSDHRPNLPLQAAIAAALGSTLPEVIHHGLLLGEDGKKLSKRHGHTSVADLREDGIPAEAVRAYLEELGLPAHDVRLDLTRLRRLSVEAISALPDEELAERAEAPVRLARALRGARTLVEAKELARQVLRPESVTLDEAARPTLERFVELRARAGQELDEPSARAIVRELKAVGGDLRALRLALTGAQRGPELWTVVAALSRDVALSRIAAVLQG